MITDTGMRGFLKWAQEQYPPAIYQRIAGDIQKRIPQAFSGYMLGGWRHTARLSGFADTAATVDTADAANSTPASPSWSDMISQIIGTATGAYLSVEQQRQQQQIIDSQLQQAQNGGKPLPVSLTSAGITFGGPQGATIGTIAVVGVLGFFAAKAMGLIK